MPPGSRARFSLRAGGSGYVFRVPNPTSGTGLQRRVPTQGSAVKSERGFAYGCRVPDSEFRCWIRFPVSGVDGGCALPSYIGFRRRVPGGGLRCRVADADSEFGSLEPRSAVGSECGSWIAASSPGCEFGFRMCVPGSGPESGPNIGFRVPVSNSGWHLGVEFGCDIGCRRQV